VQFNESGIFNYSALLLSEDKDTLYVGAREAIFALNALNISEKQHEVGPGPLDPAAFHAAPPWGVCWQHTQGVLPVHLLLLNFLPRDNLHHAHKQARLSFLPGIVPASGGIEANPGPAFICAVHKGKDSFLSKYPKKASKIHVIKYLVSVQSSPICS
jgi:hypothetical protein